MLTDFSFHCLGMLYKESDMSKTFCHYLCKLDEFCFITFLLMPKLCKHLNRQDTSNLRSNNNVVK